MREKENIQLNEFIDTSRQTVVVMGIGFVGAAMIAALAIAKGKEGMPLYNVIGVDLPTEEGIRKINMVNAGVPPVVSEDEQMVRAYKQAHENGNLAATSSYEAYKLADILIIDINVDVMVNYANEPIDYHFEPEKLLQALLPVAKNVPMDSLIVVESTVPPGTTYKLIYPFLLEKFKERGNHKPQPLLVHSYERVMPGRNYLNSVNNFYRVFAGIDKKASDKAQVFFESFINTHKFPLSRLKSTTASEMGKVLENSYRALNIAFMQEWTEFAEKAKVDLFEVLQAIRMRPTHKNIMSPGFGVGGYCLTKDALLADWAYRELFAAERNLDFSVKAILVNRKMPFYTLDLINRFFPDLQQSNILILGVSYLHDVADTRNSPTEILYDALTEKGARVQVHDPLVEFWPEKGVRLNTELKDMLLNDVQCVVLAVRHQQYLNLQEADYRNLFPGLKLLIDANNILKDEVAEGLKSCGIRVLGAGKGHWNE